MPWELFRGWQKYCRFTKPLKGEALPYLLRGGRTCGPSEGTGGVQVLLVAAPTRLGMSGAEQGAALNTQSCKTPNLRVFFSPETTFDYFFFPPLFFFFPSLSLLAAGCQRILCLTSRCFPLGWAWSYSRVTWGWQAAWPGRLVPTSPPVSSSRCSPGKQKKTPNPASASQRVLLGSGRKG